MSAFLPLSSHSRITRPRWMVLLALGFLATLGYYAALAWLAVWIVETFRPWTSWL